MASNLWLLLPALIVGVLIGVVTMQVITPPMSGTSVPSHGVSTATGCVDADDPRGWIGMVPNPDHRAVYLGNYSYVHDATDVEVHGELTASEPTAWRFAITVTPVNSGKEVPGTCQPRTVIDAAIALPTDAQLLTITADGETIAHIDLATEAPRFWYVER